MKTQLSSRLHTFLPRTILTLAGAGFAWGCGATDAAPENSGSDQSAVFGAAGDTESRSDITPSDVGEAALAGPIAPSVTPSTAPAEILAVNGSGCPKGSASIVRSQNADTFTLKFNAYSAQMGADSAVSDRRKNCLILLDLSAPAGYTYALTSASLSGSASLAAGVTAKAMVSYHFAGSSETTSYSYAIPGGASEWTTPGVFEPASLAYAPCDAQRFLSINTSVALSGQSDSAAAQSTVSVDPSTTVQLKLQRCQ